MADAAQILERVRAHGANILLDGDQLRLVNGRKLTAEAKAFIGVHRNAIAELLRAAHADAIEERAAIIEFDGGAPREWAQQFARVLFTRKPPGVDEIEWSWFVNVCGRMVDEAPARSAI